MLHRAIATLRDTLRPHLGLSKDRVETLALIVVAMVSARTVNLSHLAAERPGVTLVASTYRRLQRFFQYVQPGRDLGRDWAAPIAAKLAGLTGSWYLALDRTQWKMGAREINFLVLAAVTRRYRVPLLWTLLPGRGNSSTQQRIALMRRYIKLFGVSSIRLLLADREFIGHAWADFLCENNIPFAIRLRSDLRITTEDGHELTLDARLHWRRRGKHFTGWLGTGTGRGRHRLSFIAKPLRDGDRRGDWLILATNAKPRFALDAYRKRWAIECLFGDAKTRGLNLEDTRLSDPRKLDLLMGLVALALAWAARAARDLLGTKWPKRKAHGYLAKSWFRTGFDRIRNLLRSDPMEAIQPWCRIARNPRKICRVV
ncbi:MAG: IS4 family transposase [Limibaculum sp.]